MMRNKVIILFIMICTSISCDKYLDLKPIANIKHIETLEDVEILLNEPANLYNNHTPYLEVGSDDFEIQHSIFITRNDFLKKLYTWDTDADVPPDGLIESWIQLYSSIFYANLALESLDEIKNGDPIFKEQLRGEALMMRSYRFFQLLQTYAPPYLIDDLDSPYGIPIRLSSKMDIKPNRSTVEESYRRIIIDLNEARDLLPKDVKTVVEPSKASAIALLARIYLAIGDYENALKQSLDFLELKSLLMDFNEMNLNKNFPFDINNKEVVFIGACLSLNELLSGNIKDVSPELFNLYTENDLRKISYFTRSGPGRMMCKGSYTAGNQSYFAGFSVNEIMLIASESYIRTGKIQEGMNLLNNLLKYRYDKNSFKELKANSELEALRIVLLERQKELPFRGLRWIDLRRLNRDPRFQTRITRTYIGSDGEIKTAILEPNDLRYTYLIPNVVLQYTPMIQNKR